MTGTVLFPRAGVVVAADPPGTSASGEGDPLSPMSDTDTSSEPVTEFAPEPRDPTLPEASPRAAADRDPPRVALVLVSGADADGEEASEELAPVDPAEPVVSAKATGIAATADPTPNATASAPTRPTYDAVPVADSLACTARRRYSIACTRPLDERRWRPVDRVESAIDIDAPGEVCARDPERPRAYAPMRLCAYAPKYVMQVISRFANQSNARNGR